MLYRDTTSNVKGKSLHLPLTQRKRSTILSVPVWILEIAHCCLGRVILACVDLEQKKAIQQVLAAVQASILLGLAYQ